MGLSTVRRLIPCLAVIGVLAPICGCAGRALPTAPARAKTAGPHALLLPDTSGSGPALVVVRVTPSASVEELAANYDCDVVSYLPELRLALMAARASQTGQLTEETPSARFVGDPRVEYSEPDSRVETAETRQSTVSFSEGGRTWSDVTDQGALTRVGAAQAHAYTLGSGVLVAIVDTGIELDHPALASQLVLPGVELGEASAPGDDRAENLDSNHDGLVDGALGHGTHVAGIVHAIAPGARLLPVRVLDSDGVGNAFAVAHGIVAAVQRGATVINLSLGLSGLSQCVVQAIDFAVAHGATVVAAAGNAGLETVDLPAAYSPVLAVTGTDATDRKAEFSNYGPGVDLAAPSTSILSTFVDRGYATWSGTSMAVPFASGTAALLHGYLAARGMDSAPLVNDALREGASSLRLADPIYAWMMGSGRVNASGSVDQLIRTLALMAGEDPPDEAIER
jgi:subtilisin family serine protease